MKITRHHFIFGFIVAVVALVVFLWLTHSVKLFERLSSFRTPNSYKTDMVLFYGFDCDHCVNVDKFIEANQIESKIPLTKLEVFHSPINKSILVDKGQICHIGFDQLGVPFLWDGPEQKCVVGDSDIIRFFKQKMVKKP